MVVIIIIIAVILLLIIISKQYSKHEVLSEGGLRNIFFTLDTVLLTNGFLFVEDNTTMIEYRRRINEFTYLSMQVKKTVNSLEPYHLELRKYIDNKVSKRTIPFIISPDMSKEEFKKNIIMMESQLS
jgi:hypothetical protein